MTAGQTYRSEEFQKEQVLKRLRAAAVHLWDLQENETHDLDPIVDLILEACAVEFERTSQDAYSSQARVLQRLANLMLPEVFANARPAHAVVCARSETVTTTLQAQDQFTIDKEVQAGTAITKVPVVFSPVQATRILDAAVICQASGNAIIFLENSYHKKEKLSTEGHDVLPAHSIWLGVKINKKIDDLGSATLFFDWRNDADSRKYLPLLGAVKVSVAGSPVKMAPGIQSTDSNYLTEFDAMRELEAHVLQVYRRQFFTIGEPVIPQLCLYPSDFVAVFSSEQLKQLKEELCWIRVDFPEAIPVEAVSAVFCSINCVPVINRKLHAANRPYALSRNLNIVPLQHTEQFLCMKRVYSQERDYASVAMQGMRSTQDGAYAVRQGGVERFDQRSASALLTYLYELLRDESAAFAALGVQALSGELKSLDQSLSRFESYFAQKGVRQPSRCHLLVNSKEAEDVWIEFWSTLGEQANKIAPGKKLTMTSATNVKRDSIMLMNATSGGKAPMTDVEKLYAYKHTLLTRSRVVTEEDLRSACFAQLGSRIKDVVIQRAVKRHNGSKQGFVKVIDVVLVPAPGFHHLNWHEACSEMQAFLERRKSFMTSIQVTLATDIEALNVR